MKDKDLNTDIENVTEAELDESDQESQTVTFYDESNQPLELNIIESVTHKGTTYLIGVRDDDDNAYLLKEVSDDGQVVDYFLLDDEEEDMEVVELFTLFYDDYDIELGLD